MIKPTIGRVVWYYPAGMPHDSQPFPAFICYVHSDTMINIAGFTGIGQPVADTSVLLLQDEGSYGNPSGGSWACWMPYQKGQAAKTEAIEKELTIFETAKAARAAGPEAAY